MRQLVCLAVVLLLFRCAPDSSSLESSFQITEVSDLIKKACELKSHNADSALLFAQRAYRISEQQSYNEGIKESAIILGEICYKKGEFDRANNYLIQAESLIDPEDKSTLGKTYNWLGRVYRYSEQPDLALNYFRNAMHLLSEANDSSGLAESYGNLGHFHEKVGAYDSAIYFQNQAKVIFEMLQDSNGLASIYDNIGSIYEDLEDYGMARINFEKALKINSNLGNDVEVLVNQNNIGDVFRKTGNLEKALFTTTDVLQKSKTLDQPYQIRSAYRDLGKIHSLKGNHSLAYQYLDSSYDINSAIYGSQIAIEIADARAIYEVEQKEQQITLLEKDQQINRVSRIALGGVSILLFTIGGLIFIQLRSRERKNNKIFEAERQLAQANEERLKTELDFKRLGEEKLQQELVLRSQELTTNALHIIQKNEFLDTVKSQLKSLKKTSDEAINKRIKKIIKSIDYNFSLDDDWQEFESIFQQVHTDFFEQLRKDFPDLTSAEIRLCAMLRLNLDSKDIATIMGISQDSLRISRYRLRKKLGIPKGGNLYSFIMSVG